MPLNVNVISPEGPIWNTEIEEIVLPAVNGQLSILADHANLVTALEIGVLRIRENEKWQVIVALGGFATVNKNEVIVLLNDYEKIDMDKFNETQAELDKAVKLLDSIEDSKEKLELSQEIKKLLAVVQSYQYLKNN
jgi:F-type H+-transporting ATPase subunit epsilon